MTQTTLANSRLDNHPRAKNRDPMDEDMLRDIPTRQQFWSMYVAYYGRNPTKNSIASWEDYHPDQVRVERRR